MKPRPRPLLAMMAFLTILALVVLQREQAASVLAANYSGMARIDGRVQVDLLVSPPVGAPRDTLQLQVIATNHSDVIESPNIAVQLPANLQIEPNRLPPGAIVNLQTNAVEWLPIIPGQNGSRELSIPLKVTSADLKQPEQTIAVVLQNQGTEQTASTLIWIGIAPKITGIKNSQSISVGQLVQLQVETTGPGPFTEIWDLGDGRRIPLNSPSIVYPSPGVYEVSVTVKNPIGSATRKSEITVVPHAVAYFRPADDTPGVGEPITFLNESGGQQPLRYTWDFGDGTQSNEVQPQHTYKNSGTYQVHLLIENGYGRSEAASQVTVGSPPAADIMVADFTPAGEHIAGEALGEDSNTQYTWEMGDGRHYEGAKINHAYKQSGDYYVTLRASNEFGTTQVGRWVHVEPGIMRVYFPIVNSLSGLETGSSADGSDLGLDLGQETVDLEGLFTMESLEGAQSKPPTGQLLLYINEARRQFNLQPLPETATLSAAAQKHTDDMATTHHNQHTGSDGSVPAERQLWFGYNQGYAGEATAWGFPDPKQAVEFWVNSPSHRPIILNPYATNLGVGYSVDYSAPSVWYWTAEFGNSFAPDEVPSLRVQTPANEIEVLNSDTITFSWNWSQPLAPAEQFSIYFYGPGNPKLIGSVQSPILGTRFAIPIHLLDQPSIIGTIEWQLKLENNRGQVIAEGPRQKMVINLDPTLPTATPFPTVVPTVVITATVTPTVTPTATVAPPLPTTKPTNPPPPPLVTATPLPTP